MKNILRWFLICTSVFAMTVHVFTEKAHAAIIFRFEIGTVWSVGNDDCDGFANDSDTYVIIRIGSGGTTNYATSTSGGPTVTFNWWAPDQTVPSAVDKVRAHVRDDDSGQDGWTGSVGGDVDSNLGGTDITLYNDNAWYNSGNTNTVYGDGDNGDGDDDCPASVTIDYRNYYYDNSAPSAPGSLTVTESGQVYGSRTSTSASWGTASDTDSGIYEYQYCIGTTAGGCEVVGWTSTGLTRSATYNYDFPQGRYYWSVRGRNNDTTTFSKTLYDSSGATANYHVAGSAITDSTGFAVDKTGPTLHHIQSISDSQTCQPGGGTWCGWNYYPVSYDQTPTQARVYFSVAARNDQDGVGVDKFEFSDLTQWSSGCGCFLCCCDAQGDGVWSPWNSTGRIGVRMFDESNGCAGPSFTASQVEYDRTYGPYSTDPGTTVSVNVSPNSETISFDDSSSNRTNLDYIQIDEDCDNAGWVTAWDGSQSTDVTAFNAFSAASEGTNDYCVRAYDEGGNMTQYYDGTTIKTKFWYKKDTQAPTCSWDAGFGAYDIDGSATGVPTCTDVGISGLDKIKLRRKVNDGSWEYKCSDDTWQTDENCAANGNPKWEANGTSCTITGGQDNKHIQCGVKGKDLASPANVMSSWTDTANTLVDLNRPRVSDLTTNNFYFSPNASAGSKDDTTISGRTCDSAATVDWYKVAIKDTGGTEKKNSGNTTCPATSVCAQSNTCSACASGAYCAPSWPWDGKDSVGAYVSEGTYRAYVTSRDFAPWDSPTETTDAGKICTTETISTGTGGGVSPACGSGNSTTTNNSSYRTVQEGTQADTDLGKLCTSVNVNKAGSTSGSHSDSHSNNAVNYQVNESCSWGFCGADWDTYFSTSIPDSGITKVTYYFEMTTDGDDGRMKIYNYDTSSWLDLGIQAPSAGGPGVTTTKTVTVCENGVTRSPCSQWVSGSGTIAVKWTDGDESSRWPEGGDYFKIDEQYVNVYYNKDLLDARYIFSWAAAYGKDQVTRVELQTDAYSPENHTIYKCNSWDASCNCTAWTTTGVVLDGTENVVTFDLCSGGTCTTNTVCQNGGTLYAGILYDDNTNVDAVNHTLSIDYHVVNVTWGSSLVTIIVDNTAPNTSLDAYSPDPTSSDTLTYTGQGSDPVSGTVNSPLEKVECKVDSGSYSTSTVTDGAWDETTEDYSYNTGVLAEGSRTISCRSVDMAGNNDDTDATDTVCVDLTNPTIGFDSPAASAWEKANFTVQSDHSDSPACSSMSSCQYRVLSNAVETKTWTSFAGGCGLDKQETLTVGAGLNCQDEGADKCVIEVKITDASGRQTTSSRPFGVDWTAPVTPAFNPPAASSWQGPASFTINVSDSDATSGLASCEYMVESYNGASWDTTRTWITRTCNNASSATITVGSGGYCRNEGTDKCRVTLRATDNALNVSSTAQRLFSIDFSPPTVSAISCWESSSKVQAFTNNESYNYSTLYCEYSASDGSGSGLSATPYCPGFTDGSTDDPESSCAWTATANANTTGISNATIKYFRIKVRDAVGNKSTVTSAVYTPTSNPNTFKYIYNSAEGLVSWRYPGVGSVPNVVGIFEGGGTIRTGFGGELRVYGGSRSGIFYALDAATGALRWTPPLDISAYGAVSSPPLMFGGKIYLGTENGYVLRISDNGGTGAVDYASAQLGGGCSIQSATLAITISSATKILVGCGDKIYALNDTGASFTSWWTSVALSGNVTRSIPAYAVLPAGTDPYLYVGTQNGTSGGIHKIDIINNGAILNTFNDTTAFTGFMILRNYFGDGNQWLYAGGANSNKFYVMKTDTLPASCASPNCYSFTASGGADNNFEGGAAVSSGGSVIYAGNNNGTLYRLNFSSVTGLSSPYNFTGGGGIGAIKYGITFRQATGKLYFGTNAGLFFTVTDSGSFVENMRYHTGASVSATPAVTGSGGGKVVIPSTIGRIFSFGL